MAGHAEKIAVHKPEGEEAEYRADYRLLRHMVRDMDESLIVLSRDAEVAFTNPSTDRMLGYSAGELLGVPFGAVVDDENLDFFRAVKEIITKGPVRDMDLLYISRRGEKVPVSVNGSALRDDSTGELYGILIVARDMRRVRALISELESANEGLEAKVAERTRELERAHAEQKETQSFLMHREKMASIGQLAAGVAHEINNPIAFILSNLVTLDGCMRDAAEMLRKYDDALRSRGAEREEALRRLAALKEEAWFDESLTEARDVIRETKEGAEAVKTIVANLREFSHVDSAEFVDYDVNGGLESTLNIAYNELKYKADIVKDYGHLPRVRCRGGELNQAFLNILINAGQALAERGEIRIRTRFEAGAVAVEISDTGCGIPEETLPRIFEPFFTTKPVGEGTGLGLSITYSIVKRHGGEISVKSAPGAGTAFTITLPVEADGKGAP